MVEGVGGVTQSARGGCCKDVSLFGRNIVALIDSSSDLLLMHEWIFVEVGAPPLRGDKVRFRGIGSGVGEAFGKFCTELEIDGHPFSVIVHVVADSMISL